MPARNRTFRVLPGARPWSLKRRLTHAFSAFSAIWILVAPSFSFSPVRISNPLLAYTTMVALAIASTVTAEFVSRRKILGQQRLIRITIVLTQLGREVVVETASDLAAGAFVDEFLRSVLFGRRGHGYSWEVVSLYENNLLVPDGKDFVPADSRLTLAECGIGNGTKCKIGGFILLEYHYSTLHIDSPEPTLVTSDQIEQFASQKMNYDGPAGAHATLWTVETLDSPSAHLPSLQIKRVLDALNEAGYRYVA